jgi:hypothetical protein
MIDIRRPDPDEPAVFSPELRRLVDVVRAEPPPAVNVDIAAISAAVDEQRRGRRRGLLVLAGAAAAVIALVSVLPDMSARPGPVEPVAQNMAAAPVAPAPGVTPPAPEAPAPTPAAPTLAPEIRAVAEAGPAPTVRGPWEIELPPGRYDLEVGAHPGLEVLIARTPNGAVEVAYGRVSVVVAGDSTEAVLRTGVAVWVAPDGARTPIAGEVVPEDMPETPGVSAAELARRAEKLLAAGKRDAAAPVLRELVTTYPHSAAARGALIDLGRILKADGKVDEARCAYKLYLARYAGKQHLVSDVQQALERLGDGPACRGLRPVK